MGFWKSLFKSSKRESWKAFSDEAGGTFTKGGFFKSDTLSIPYKKWEVFFDTYTEGSGNTSTIYTRVRSVFITKDNLYLRIYREGFFSAIGKIFNMQDIKVNDIQFDDRFIIKGNQEYKIKQFFSNSQLRQKLLIQKNISLEIKTAPRGFFEEDYPNGVNAIFIIALGVIKTKKELHNLLEIAQGSLDGLVNVGSAESFSPGFKLGS